MFYGRIYAMELDSFTSLLLYLVIFLSASIFAYLGHKSGRKSFWLFAILLPAVLAGLRYSAGTDSLAYRSFYAEVNEEDWSYSVLRITTGEMEPLIVLLSRLGGFLNLGASSMLFCFALITTIFFALCCKKYNSKYSWLCYGLLIFMAFPESFNMMRQMAAISVQAYLLCDIAQKIHLNEKNNILKIIVLSILAYSLHYSSLILLPVLALPWITKHCRYRRIIFSLSLIAVFCMFALPFTISLVSDLGILSQKHLDTLLSGDGSLININFFATFILAIAFILNTRRTKSDSDRQKSILMLAGVSYSAIGFYSGYLGRLSTLFWIFIITAIVDIVAQLFQKESHRVAISSAVAIVYFVLYFGVLGFSQIMPYSLLF